MDLQALHGEGDGTICASPYVRRRIEGGRRMSDLKQIEARLIELIQAIDDLRRSLEVRHEQTPIFQWSVLE